ncbi:MULTISPECIES: Rid family hydrolase [unclassified Agrococcus]|uniref:Rid family hydrolase n=1 Tax=unclassified Agrococcus TaxID=2615065 RepID=UPI0036082C2D
MDGLRLVRSPLLGHGDDADAAIVHAERDVVLAAGACPLDGDGAVVALGDVAAQARQALVNLDAVLRRCGVEVVDVAFLRVPVVATDPEQLHAAWSVVRAHLGDHQPAATLQSASALGCPGRLVEIEAIATRTPG